MFDVYLQEAPKGPSPTGEASGNESPAEQVAESDYDWLGNLYDEEGNYIGPGQDPEID